MPTFRFRPAPLGVYQSGNEVETQLVEKIDSRVNLRFLRKILCADFWLNFFSLRSQPKTQETGEEYIEAAIAQEVIARVCRKQARSVYYYYTLYNVGHFPLLKLGFSTAERVLENVERSDLRILRDTAYPVLVIMLLLRYLV